MGFSMYRRLRVAILLSALIALAGSRYVLADSPSVTAVLNNDRATVGETAQLQIRVSNSRGADAPDNISVDGLEIHRTGTEQHVEMNNFNVTSSVVYNYTILPMKAGTFKIPPQTIRVAGRDLTTPELTLHVASSGGAASRSQPNGTQPQTLNAKNIGFLEFVVPKRTGYVGEVLPVEIKIGLNSHVQFQGRPELPDLNVQGVTLQRAQEGEQNIETIGGVTYQVITCKGALAAIHAGKIEVPPLETAVIALVRRSAPPSSKSRSRSPFDVFGMRDPFDDPFFSDPFGVFSGEPTKLSLKSEPVTLEIKSLPANPPASFSGAVGHFAMTAEAKPKNLQVGDPITVTATISGRGNFDRMGAPGLEDERGWHKYPPSAKFKQDDDVGISGAKTFEMVISPNEKKSSIPPLSFAYFDPLKEDYVTVRSDPIPVQVEGIAVATAQPAPGTPASQPGSLAPVTAKPQDILYQLKDFGRTQSFTAIYARPVFWRAQVVPLLVLLGFAGWKIRQGKIDNRQARRTAALQHESAELLRKLRRRDLSPQEYFSNASRAVRIKAALVQDIDPNTVDAEVAQSAFGLDENSRGQLRRLFQRSDELRYSGRPNGMESTSPQDREEILNLIENLHA
jgi:BatD DUF11 like domain